MSNEVREYVSKYVSVLRQVNISIDEKMKSGKIDISFFRQNLFLLSDYVKVM